MLPSGFIQVRRPGPELPARRKTHQRGSYRLANALRAQVLGWSSLRIDGDHRRNGLSRSRFWQPTPTASLRRSAHPSVRASRRERRPPSRWSHGADRPAETPLPASDLDARLGKGDVVVMGWSEGNRAAMARAQKKPAYKSRPSPPAGQLAWMG
jgi:hypothetical protein